MLLLYKILQEKEIIAINNFGMQLFQLEGL